MPESLIVAQEHNLLRHLTSAQVLFRFFVRMAILATFAAFGSIGFGRSLSALLWMAIIFSAVAAIIKRERPFGAILNHWDETVAYAAVFALVSIFTHAMPA
jgi:hypothetical protein